MSVLSPFINKPHRQRRKEVRPQELLAAALDLFVERGFAVTRMEDVVKRAGVSKGTLYIYFANKEELFKAVVRENMLPVLGEAEAMIDSFEGDSVNLFRNIVLGWWEQVGNTTLAGITKLVMAESGNFPELAKFYHDEVISRSNALIGRLLLRGVGRGEFRQLDIPHLTKVIMAPMIMLMMWKYSFGACQTEPISSKEYLISFIDLCLRGLLNNEDGA